MVCNAKKFEGGRRRARRGADQRSGEPQARRASAPFPTSPTVHHFKAVAALAFEAGGDENHARKSAAADQENRAGALLLELPGPCHRDSAPARCGRRHLWYAGFAGAASSDPASRSPSCTRPMASKRRRDGDRAVLPMLAGTKNREGAEAFLDAYTGPRCAVRIFRKPAGTVPMNEAARMRLKEEPGRWRDVLLLTDAELKNAFTVDCAKVDMVRWRDRLTARQVRWPRNGRGSARAHHQAVRNKTQGRRRGQPRCSRWGDLSSCSVPRAAARPPTAHARGLRRAELRYGADPR